MRGIWKFTALVGLAAFALLGPAHGQTLICFKSATGSGCTPVSAAAPLPVTGTISASTTARATNAAPTYVEGSDDPLSVDLSGALRVTVAGGTVTGYAQGSTTSGQLGGLTQAAVTTAAPSYTTTQTSPLSLTTAGQLRTQSNLASGAVLSGAFASGSLASGSVASGAMVDLGTQADAVCATDTGTCSAIALIKKGNANTSASVPAGAALIGDVNLRQGGTALSTTNGIFGNVLQGNAVLSATNGIFANCLLGNAACATGTGAVGATSQRVAVAVDSATVAGSATLPTGTNTIGSVKQTDGTTVVVTDPCQGSVKSYLPITLATAAVKVIATGVSAKKIYVCAIDLTNNAADSVAIFEATTATVCVTSPVAVKGAGTSVATAATGYNFGANGGISLGNGGFSVMQTATNANDLCIAQSAATQLTGGIYYVTQ